MDFSSQYIYQSGSGTVIPIEKLSDYATKNGIVIPQTSAIRSSIENMMKDIFGTDMSVEPETPVGRLVEALTFMFIDVLGVNAQNANNFNPETAVGSYLDSLGKLWGVTRYEDESDNDYRNRILSSQSRGSGFPQSVMQAISQVIGANACCVLNNGHKDVEVLPDQIRGIQVDGHSIYICVDCSDSIDVKNAVARAIYSANSAGCGYTQNGDGEKVSVEITESAGGTTEVVFYRPTQKEVTMEVKIRGGSYTGTDIEGATRQIINDYIGKHKMNAILNEGDIISAVALSGTGIVCTEAKLYIGTDQFDEIVIRPSEVLYIPEDGITVIV